jgi:ubiquinol-cytochrome c reductase cytochrome b/c1 subunit
MLYHVPIPDKLLGVIFLALGIAVLYVLPFILTPAIKSLKFKPLPRFMYWIFLCICFILGWIGACNVAYPLYSNRSIICLFYTFHFF